MRVVTHLASLRQPAGVEAHFSEFIRQAHSLVPGYRHGWLDAAGGMHPFVAERLASELAHTIRAKHFHGLKLPAWPPVFRRWHCRRAFAACGTDLLVVWNRMAKTAFAVDAIGPDRCIHWEHGAAWDEGHEAERREYLARIPVAIANSVAASRVLQLRWNYGGEVHVCRNALRPSLVPAAPVQERRLRSPLRLGVAARLYPVKGVAIAIHALKDLTTRGLAAELHVAGEGPQRTSLEDLAVRLGVAALVRFHGAVKDMAAFYAGIDCLIHVPITEAFGLVVLEAAAHGCPVLAARVDGLAESVADGVTGHCISPVLSLDDYAALGGGSEGLPAFVYDPERDALATPRAVAPNALACAVEELVRNEERYVSFCAGASLHVLSSPTFAAHVRDVMTVIDGFF